MIQDARTGTVRAVLPVRSSVQGFTIPSAAFTADGRWLAVVVAADPAADRPSGRIAVFRAADLSAAPRLVDVGSPITGIATGRRDIGVTTSAGDVIVLDAARLTVTHRARRAGLPTVNPEGDGDPVAMASDGSRIAVGLADGSTALALATSDLDGVGVRLGGGAQLSTLAFSPTGRLIAAGSEDGAVTVTDARTGAIDDRFSDSGPVHGLTWGGASDAGGLFSGGLDSELSDWVLGGSPPMFTESGSAVATALTVRTGGRVVGLAGVLAGTGSRLRLLSRVVDAPSTASWPLHLAATDSVTQVATDASGRSVVVSVADAAGRVRCEVLDSATGRSDARLDVPAAADSSQDCAISRDGRTLAASLTRNRIGFFALPGLRRTSVVTVRPSGPHAARIMVVPLWFGPDGRLVVQGVDPGPASLPTPKVGSTAPSPELSDQRLLDVDPRTGHVVGQLALGPDGNPWDIEWSADGTRLAVATGAGRVYLVDARRFAITAQAPAAAGFALSASFSPDGSMLVTGGTDGTMRFFDARTLQPIGPPIRLASQNWWQAFYVGHEVVGLAPTGQDSQRWFRFAGDPRVWARTACELAGSTLTRTEWRQYLANRPYRDVCPG